MYTRSHTLARTSWVTSVRFAKRFAPARRNLVTGDVGRVTKQLSFSAFHHPSLAVRLSQRDQCETFEILQHARTLAVLAIFKAAWQPAAPKLQDVACGRAIGEFLPEFIPHSLTRIAQEHPGADLQEPA